MQSRPDRSHKLHLDGAAAAATAAAAAATAAAAAAKDESVGADSERAHLRGGGFRAAADGPMHARLNGEEVSAHLSTDRLPAR